MRRSLKGRGPGRREEGGSTWLPCSELLPLSSFVGTFDLVVSSQPCKPACPEIYLGGGFHSGSFSLCCLGYSWNNFVLTLYWIKKNEKQICSKHESPGRWKTFGFPELFVLPSCFIYCSSFPGSGMAGIRAAGNQST